MVASVGVRGALALDARSFVPSGALLGRWPPLPHAAQRAPIVAPCSAIESARMAAIACPSACDERRTRSAMPDRRPVATDGGTRVRELASCLVPAERLGRLRQVEAEAAASY